MNSVANGMAMGKARRSVVVILLTMTVLTIGALFFVSLTYFKSLDREAADTRLALYVRSLNDTLERHQHFPFVLAQDPLVKRALAETSASTLNSLNERLARFAVEAKLEAIYLMDRNGAVLASSNHNKPHSFVGQNYGFRPYFQKAVAGNRADYFGVGATTGRPGYFVSQPVETTSGGISGVMAIKLDASELQQTWERGDENVLASNPDGIVVLASNRDWLFRTLQDLSETRLSEISASKQFGREGIRPWDWAPQGSDGVAVSGNSYIYSSRGANHLGWTVHYLLGEGRAYERALLTTIVFGAGLVLLVMFASFMRSQRIRLALQASQHDRTQLLDANRKLEQAHTELARSSKLAALGHLSASVVHELGQPISALRNYLAAAELAPDAKPHPAQDKLNGVVDRMEHITKQLRFFTTPGDQAVEPVSLNAVIGGSMDLMRHDLEEAQIHTQLDVEPNVIVMGNRLRLEQVLVNLLKNALHALEETNARDLYVKLTTRNNEALLSVEDRGVGFGDRNLSDMQEPFHTTRSSGDGMGLGLSISSAIIKDHHGQLSAKAGEPCGAIFQVTIPLAANGKEQIQ